MTAKTYRKKPVEIQAIQWTGDNASDVREFAEPAFAVLHDLDRELLNNPECTAELYVAANSVWMAIETGEWILQDERGFYPCKPDIFAQTYDEVPQ